MERQTSNVVQFPNKVVSQIGAFEREQYEIKGNPQIPLISRDEAADKLADLLRKALEELDLSIPRQHPNLTALTRIAYVAGYLRANWGSGAR